MRYLGIWIKAATVFKCNFHASKLKFFRSLNGILGKVGSSLPPHLTLSLTSTFCNPILLYGLESLHINKYDINSLSFPFDSVFMKLFSSFNKDVITLCQFYSGYLPLKFEIDKKTLRFYEQLSSMESYTPACVLYRWFGIHEHNDLAATYNISSPEANKCISNQIKDKFNDIVSVLI